MCRFHLHMRLAAVESHMMVVTQCILFALDALQIIIIDLRFTAFVPSAAKPHAAVLTPSDPVLCGRLRLALPTVGSGVERGQGRPVVGL